MVAHKGTGASHQTILQLQACRPATPASGGKQREGAGGPPRPSLRPAAVTVEPLLGETSHALRPGRRSSSQCSVRFER